MLSAEPRRGPVNPVLASGPVIEGGIGIRSDRATDGERHAGRRLGRGGLEAFVAWPMEPSIRLRAVVWGAEREAATSLGHYVGALARRHAAQTSGPSLPRSGTVRPLARAQARTSAVEGSGADGARSRSVAVAPFRRGRRSIAAGSVSAHRRAAARNRYVHSSAS